MANGPPTGGAVILTATNNSFTGGTLISSGTLQVGDGATNAGSLPGNSVVNNGRLILDPPAATSLSVSGVISSNGNLVMLGNGLATLTGSNTYTGPTLISAGTLQLGNGASLSSASTVTDNGTLAFKDNGTLTQGTNFSSAAITGSGGVVQAGPGLVTLNAANTFTGNIVVSGGTLVASHDAGASSAATALGNVTAGQTITVGSGGVLQFATQNVMGEGTLVPPTAQLTIQQGGLLLATVGSNANMIGPLNLSGGTLYGAVPLRISTLESALRRPSPSAAARTPISPE